MAEITASAVKQLRELTDLPMMKCKQALVEASGDQEKAIEILRKGVEKLRLKRAENVTAEGIVKILITDDHSQAVMVELQCESDPVARSESFQFLADQLAKQLLHGPGASTPEELFQQPAPDADGKTLTELFDDTFNKLGEKLSLAKVVRVDGPVGGYVHHDGKTGVLFQATGEADDYTVLRDVAMHIAALQPTACSPEELDPALVSAERARLTEEAKASGKPDNIVDKIVDGRLKVFYVENGVLTLQPFAKDDSKTVSQALAEHGLKAKGFVRWVIGN